MSTWWDHSEGVTNVAIENFHMLGAAFQNRLESRAINDPDKYTEGG